MDKIVHTPVYEVMPYTSQFAPRWNEFVKSARNSTFLFERGYMDYHADRFRDCSWIALKNGRVAALLPGNVDEDMILHSHGGLTYGGWILPQGHIDGSDLLHIFEVAVETWRSREISVLDYKPLPFIFADKPSQEDIYALFRLGAEQTECNLSAAIDLREEVKFNQLQRRHLKKALQLPGLKISETEDIEAFMSMLGECLAERHGVKAVHTAGEISLLKSRFPENIHFFVSKIEGQPQAGICIYDCGATVHAQYIATTALGRELNLLTPLVAHIIEKYADRRFLDFGISNEDHGLVLNEGLLRQKYSYSATGVAYTRWSLKL
ncbi:MAG: GNAT family N-acetyltransferase [Muribaculaceae bacterium]|nr:GNAT family N-acetyltransferase [Muribaculaceae bacterium]